MKKETVIQITDTIIRTGDLYSDPPANFDFDQSVITQLAKSLSNQFDKQYLNSLYGNFMPQHDLTFTAQMVTVDEGDLRYRVKIRCPEYRNIERPTAPSESHACESFARRTVRPWIEENISGAFRQTNYAVFCFEDEEDALLCLVRFK